MNSYIRILGLVLLFLATAIFPSGQRYVTKTITVDGEVYMFCNPMIIHQVGISRFLFEIRKESDPRFTISINEVITDFYGFSRQNMPVEEYARLHLERTSLSYEWLIKYKKD